MIFDSAVRVAATAAALSPESIALTAFLVNVLTWDRRAMLTAFFFAVTNIRFFADLWFAIFNSPLYLLQDWRYYDYIFGESQEQGAFNN